MKAAAWLCSRLYLDQPALRRRALIMGLLVLAVSCSASLILWQKLHSDRLRALTIRHDALLSAASADISRELGDISRIMKLMYLDTGVRRALSSDADVNSGQLAARFVNFSGALGNLLQIRWLDADGNERVRVDFNSRLTVPVVTAEKDLQNKSSRYYFREAIRYPPGQVYLSEIDLNIEHDEIVTPYEPTLRAAVRTGVDDGLQAGVLIVNYDLSALLRGLATMSDEALSLSLVDQYGFWLINRQQEKEWGRDTGHSDFNLAQEDPALWQRIGSQRPLLGLDWHGELISCRRINFVAGSEEQGRTVFLLADTPRAVMQGVLLNNTGPAAILFLILFLSGSRLLIYDMRNMSVQNSLSEQLEHDKQALIETNQQLNQSISEQQLLQDELVETRKLSALGMMVAGVAHELNTPVGGAIMMASDLAEENRILKEAFHAGLSRKALETYIGNADEALRLLSNNLSRAKSTIDSFKRLAIDRASDEQTDFVLNQVVDDLVNSMRPLLKREHIRLDVRLPEDISMTGYPGVISQILQNLMVNSVRHAFSSAGEHRITLTAGCEEPGRVRIYYADNGRGVEETMLGRMFDPFITSARGEGSTGLGLHLVQQWVSRILHGSIKVSTPQGGGLAFVITIPRNTPEQNS